MRKWLTEQNWDIFYKTMNLYTSKLSRSWHTEELFYIKENWLNAMHDPELESIKSYKNIAMIDIDRIDNIWI